MLQQYKVIVVVVVILMELSPFGFARYSIDFFWISVHHIRRYLDRFCCCCHFIISLLSIVTDDFKHCCKMEKNQSWKPK